MLPGYNVRPLEMSGAIGIEQLKKLPEFLEIRKSNALFLQNLFSDEKRFYLQNEISESSWFGFSFIIKNSSKIDVYSAKSSIWHEPGVRLRGACP